MEVELPSKNTPDIDADEKRFSAELSSLSTKLIEAIDKQSSLETSNQTLKRQNQALQLQLEELSGIKELHDKFVDENLNLKTELLQNIKLKTNAEQEISRLRVEIEDLSESLFDEANKMVKEARVETESFKDRNNKLSETLLEKETTIESLSNELKILKDLLYQLENEGTLEKRKSIVSNDPSSESLIGDRNDDAISLSQRDPTTLQSQTTIFASTKLGSYDKQLIYTPIYNSLRFDLENFQEFVRFVKFLYDRNSHSPIVTPVDFNILKETAFFKKIYKEEIEPSLAVDSAPGISFFNRKNFISALVEGRVIIEPISGVNESFKLNHKKPDPEDSKEDLMFSYPKNSPPVATLSACSICGEARNDILEHSRLYTLKLYSKKTANITLHKYDPPASPATVTTLLPNEEPKSQRATLEITHQYSLCNYCLIKIRHICELFALIRNINNSPKTKVWNFNPETQPKYDLDLECIKAWFQMTKVRAKIFWSRVGIWDINEYTSTIPDTPPLKHELNLGYRGSVIGTGIVAGDRQSFMESISSEGIVAPNLGRRADIISSVKSSPVIRSPLATQVQGYFEDESAAAELDDSEIPDTTEIDDADTTELLTPKENGDDSGDILDAYGEDEEELELEPVAVEVKEDELKPVEVEVKSSAGSVKDRINSIENSPIKDKIKAFEKSPIKDKIKAFENSPVKDQVKEESALDGEPILIETPEVDATEDADLSIDSVKTAQHTLDPLKLSKESTPDAEDTEDVFEDLSA